MSLVSCGKNKNDSSSASKSTHKQIQPIDDNVKIVFKSDTYSNLSVSDLSSNTGIYFDKGKIIDMYFKINKNIKITSVSYDILFEGVYLNDTLTKTISDENIEDWSPYYKDLNTDKGNGEHCYNLITEYSF